MHWRMVFELGQNVCHSNVKCLLKLFIRTHSSLFSFFSVFTRYPLITLGVCATIVVGLSVGVFFMEITTDPVELWAGKDSRSRAEKDYFDNTFGPFYRAAQVFIKPTYKENVSLNKKKNA